MVTANLSGSAAVWTVDGRTQAGAIAAKPGTYVPRWNYDLFLASNLTLSGSNVTSVAATGPDAKPLSQISFDGHTAPGTKVDLGTGITAVYGGCLTNSNAGAFATTPPGTSGDFTMEFVFQRAYSGTSLPGYESMGAFVKSDKTGVKQFTLGWTVNPGVGFDNVNGRQSIEDKYIHHAILTRVSGQLYIYVDGVLTDSIANSTDVQPALFSLGIYPDSNGYALANPATNYLLAAFSTTSVSASDVSNLYLYRAVQLANAGFDTPATLAKITMFYFGDSIGQGYPLGNATATPSFSTIKNLVGNGKTQPKSYNISLGGISLNQSGSNGQVLAQTDRYLPFITRHTGVKNVIIHLGTNDIAFGATGAQTYNRLCNLVSQIRVANTSGTVNVFVGTMLHRGASLETERTNLNTLIRANGGDVFGIYRKATAIIDFDTNSNLTNSSNTTYFYGDAVHPNATGAAQMALVAEPILRSYF